MVRTPYHDRLSRSDGRSTSGLWTSWGMNRLFIFGNPLSEIRDPGARLRCKHEGVLCLNLDLLWLALTLGNHVDFDPCGDGVNYL